MTNTEILESWRDSVKKSALATFLRFKKEPKRILTESDLKCNLYMDLFAQKPYVKYALHTEVTHYTGELNPVNPVNAVNPVNRRKYRFRDMSLLCPWLLNENEELWHENEHLLSKGFIHRGPAFHLELKIKRQGVNENDESQISAMDIDNLNGLNITEGREKRFAIIWLSKSENYQVNHMKTQVQASIARLNENKKYLIDVYLINRNASKRLFYSNEVLQEEDLN